MICKKLYMYYIINLFNFYNYKIIKKNTSNTSYFDSINQNIPYIELYLQFLSLKIYPNEHITLHELKKRKLQIMALYRLLYIN